MNTEWSEKRLDNIVNLLTEFSKGNFDARDEVTDDDDAFNTVISGLNMLGEELAHYRKQLNERNSFLQNILSSVDEVIYAREVKQDNPSLSPYTFISGRCVEIIGLSAEELEQQPDKWIKAVHPDDEVPSLKAIEQIVRGEEIVFTYRMYHSAQKRYIWLEDRVVPEINNEGIVTQVFGSARDITAQREITEELKNKNELVSRLISSSDQFFYIVSLDPEDSFKNNFTYCSWQIEKIQGSTPAGIKKNPLGWLHSIHPDDMAGVREANHTMFSTKQPVTRTYRTRHAKTGEYIWLEDYVVPVTDETGYICELYGSARDITTRKKAEEEREKLIRELSNRYNEMMQFNYVVSHNMRAPVAHIIGLSQLLDTNMSEADKNETMKYIQEAAKNMDNVLHDLNIILSARSQLNEKVEPFLLREVVNSVCASLKSETDKWGAVIKTDIDDSTTEIVSVKSYIQSCIFNLVANAIKYRAQDRQPVITVTARKDNEHAVITVADNGTGIDLSAHQDRIFGLYNRFHMDVEGKGLGLYMTKTQIESLGGSIAVESTVGEGTIFTITL